MSFSDNNYFLKKGNEDRLSREIIDITSPREESDDPRARLLRPEPIRGYGGYGGYGSNRNQETSAGGGGYISRWGQLDGREYHLNQAQNSADQAEEIGRSVLIELGGQKESLARSQAKMGTIDQSLSRSDRVLRWMRHRQITNKFLCMLVIFLIIGIAGIIVYFSVKK